MDNGNGSDGTHEVPGRSIDVDVTGTTQTSMDNNDGPVAVPMDNNDGPVAVPMDNNSVPVPVDNGVTMPKEQIRQVQESNMPGNLSSGTGKETYPIGPKGPGSYILGQIQGVGCAITIDPGATRTVISERVFYRIPRNKRPKLFHKGASFDLAKEGSAMKILGKARFKIKLGPIEGSPPIGSSKAPR